MWISNSSNYCVCIQLQCQKKTQGTEGWEESILKISDGHLPSEAKCLRTLETCGKETLDHSLASPPPRPPNYHSNA